MEVLCRKTDDLYIMKLELEHLMKICELWKEMRGIFTKLHHFEAKKRPHSNQCAGKQLYYQIGGVEN